MKQTEGLLEVLDEQTSDIKAKDQEILQLSQDKSHGQGNEQELRKLQGMVDELQNKLTTEMVKKRQMKAEEELNRRNATEELDYYKGKHSEMSELLRTCKSQIK